MRTEKYCFGSKALRKRLTIILCRIVSYNVLCGVNTNRRERSKLVGVFTILTTAFRYAIYTDLQAKPSNGSSLSL